MNNLRHTLILSLDKKSRRCLWNCLQCKLTSPEIHRQSWGMHKVSPSTLPERQLFDPWVLDELFVPQSVQSCLVRNVIVGESSHVSSENDRARHFPVRVNSRGRREWLVTRIGKNHFRQRRAQFFVDSSWWSPGRMSHPCTCDIIWAGKWILIGLDSYTESWGSLLPLCHVSPNSVLRGQQLSKVAPQACNTKQKAFSHTRNSYVKRLHTTWQAIMYWVVTD